jgi:hypothetical protein
MALWGFFRRRPRIREIADLADFIEAQSAYLVQRYIYDYTNARAGPYSKSLWAQPEFAEAMERSRWRAFPLGLAMVGEMVEGVLRRYSGDRRGALLESLSRLVLEVFDRHQVPAALGADVWQACREELARRLDQIGLHPPKSVSDIPEPYVERYFGMMPFDKSLLSNDVPTTRAYLRLNLINIRDELVKRMDAADMAAMLTRQPA